MTPDDISSHLEDNTSLNDEQIKLFTSEILSRLDYTPMWEQVDILTALLINLNTHTRLT